MTSIEQASRKYDAIADRYEEMFFYVSDVGQRLIEMADPDPGAQVLDVGAGRGAVARAALARDCVVTAIDASPRMVQCLVADYPAVRASVMDAARLDFQDAEFDLVTASFVVQILPDLPTALAEMRRVLAPGGTVALSLETQSIERVRWLYDLTVEFFPAAGEPGRSPLAADPLDEALTAAGFADVTRVAIDLPLTFADASAFWDWLTPRGLTEAVQQLPPDRAQAFHNRFLAAAQTTAVGGVITVSFAATLHLARKIA